MELLYFHPARNLANMTDVGFYDRFELLEMLRDDGVKSFRAKEISTGRDVEAHIFVNPHAPDDPGPDRTASSRVASG